MEPVALMSKVATGHVMNCIVVVHGQPRHDPTGRVDVE